MTREQRDDARYEAIMIVNELHKTIDYSVYCRLIDLIDMLGLPDETCAAEYPKPAQPEQGVPLPTSAPSALPRSRAAVVSSVLLSASTI